MNLFRTCVAGTLLFVVATAAGCGGGTTAPAPATRPSAGSAAELEAIYRARVDSARTRFHEADAHFMSHMIAHHAQALVMARLAPTHGASPSVRTLAARIINAQQDEIEIMQTWLRDRGLTVPEVHITGTTLMVHGAGEHAMHMPGMLTPEQLRTLDRARGAEFDRLFLTYMIEHHRGAVTMVQELFSTDGAAQDVTVFRFASDVQVDQITEIARMESMLAALPARGSGG
jgi:uncharacterized protein (DUF305 family)